MKEFEITLDGQSIHGVKWGNPENPPVVCMHGLTNNALGFIEVAEELQDQFHLIAFDLPGHGKTDAFMDENSYLFKPFSEWLNAIITKVCSSPVYMLGHSWGAAIAVHYASLYKEDVKGIVMLDGGYICPSDEPSTNLDEHLQNISNWINDSNFKSITKYEEKKKEEVGRWSEALQKMVRADMTADGGGVRMRTREETARAIMKALYNEPSSKLFKDITVPVYLLRGTLPEEAEPVRVDAVDSMRSAIKSECRISAIEDAGHVLHWQKPTEVISDIRGWLAAQEDLTSIENTPRSF
ncbi:alpha/beta fold hydrolase [Guptibacillus algicola]|uniref:alpha/beta fold hydrolase n=1 Tax=Guptibacillus algicola TaxID=225844 RepID=UPI001CD60624|nr:alpha/beta hydrolase [Alkalihalobacillus algicola]MCA0989022.1 alpha/beta hydrolase [Alkalihalobacillus algicola]